jgi:glycosyltransferase involved in cell wall biosynthesis
VQGFAADVTPHLAAASVFAFPALDEGSAKVVSEAMAAGLAVVTTREAGSLVEDGKTGFLVPAGDAEALADRLAYLQGHPHAAAELGRAAREAILPFTWSRYRAGFLEMYRTAAEGARAARG